MNQDDFKLETFNILYKQGMAYKDQGNYLMAKRDLLKASICMTNIAKNSNGELREARLERAKRIMMIAESLPDQNGMPPMNPVPQSTSRPVQQNNSSSGNDKTQSQDSTETIWQSAEIPNISFEDIAGLDDVKESINMRVILPLRYPEIYAAYNKKNGGGILLYGLPGTGKTMMAKAIAHEVNAKFYSVKCSDIVSKWFGEAEKNVKNLFETARKDDKAIIFFDEFEAIAARRGGENNAVMNRLVPELLSQMQGFNDKDKDHILLLAATNRPWDIDSAMLRPGRFNEMICVNLPDAPAREYMIKKALKNIPIEDNVSVEEIVNLTDGFSGADVEEFCERLKDQPIRRSIEDEGKVIHKISTDDVEYAKTKVKTTIQQKDIEELNKFKEQFDKAN